MIKELIKKYAYKIVYKDLIKTEGLLIFKYDEKHGGKEFMSGVYFVMGYIAYRVSEDIGDAFYNLFISKIDSERR